MPEVELRGQVAAQLDELLSSTEGRTRPAVQHHDCRELSPRAPDTSPRPAVVADDGPIPRSPERDTREGRAALLTAGVPGAGKSTVVSQLGVVDEGWRRLDADVVKDYLIEELAGTGHVDDLLGRRLIDGQPIMPAELASLVHLESVIFIDELRTDCLARGENVVIEGTLSWPPSAQRLLLAGQAAIPGGHHRGRRGPARRRP